MAGRIIEVGEKVGRLTVVARRLPTEPHIQCVCACGAKVSVSRKHWGRNQSCGCLNSERTLASRTKHGMTGSPEFTSWSHMIQRCTNPNSRGYEKWGGRGITVCERWLEFANFYADMGDRPAGHTLDRIDNEKGYSLDNCRWATPKEQANNRRRRRRENKTHCPRSHEYTPENTYLDRRGTKKCRTCHRERAATAYARRRAVAA